MNNVYSQDDIRKLFISIPLSRVTLETGFNKDLIHKFMELKYYLMNKCHCTHIIFPVMRKIESLQ